MLYVESLTNSFESCTPFAVYRYVVKAFRLRSGLAKLTCVFSARRSPTFAESSEKGYLNGPPNGVLTMFAPASRIPL